MFKIKVEQEVTIERVVDLIIGAFEGGSAYWVERLLYKRTMNSLNKEFSYPYYSDHNFWSAGNKVDIYYEETECKTLGYDDFNCGLQIMANKYPRHFGNFMNENDDAETADVFLQCCLFGEVVYG